MRDAATGVCEYHAERKGVFVSAAFVVNDEWMCKACFNGRAIFPFERIGDDDAELERDRKERYFERHPEALVRKYQRNAAWRARQRASTCPVSVSAS